MKYVKFDDSPEIQAAIDAGDIRNLTPGKVYEATPLFLVAAQDYLMIAIDYIRVFMDVESAHQAEPSRLFLLLRQRWQPHRQKAENHRAGLQL